MTVKILLENVLRNAGGGVVREDDVARAGGLAAARRRRGRDPVHARARPAAGLHRRARGRRPRRHARRDGRPRRRPGDESTRSCRPTWSSTTRCRSTASARADAFAFNVEREYERNGERYQLLRWAQTAFDGLRVVPPGTGIVHQVNLEYLAPVVVAREDDGGPTVAFPDTLVGTDSHTTMVNGLGVLGYGVGGIEAEAVLLGQPLYQPMPRVVGVRLTATCRAARPRPTSCWSSARCCATHGVVGSFVEFAGDGLASLALADRATISNMSPEYGATAALFPIDDETLAYLRQTGRPAELIALVERYAKENGLWREPGAGPDFDEALELDLSTVEPTLAGPRRPQDKVALPDLPRELPRRPTRTRSAERRACRADARLDRRGRPTATRRSTGGHRGGRPTAVIRTARWPSRPSRPAPTPATRR